MEAKAEEPKPEPKAEAKKAEEPKPEAKKAEAKPKAAIEKAEEKAVEKKKAAEPEKKGGFPWLAVILAIAVAIVVYQVFLSKK